MKKRMISLLLIAMLILSIVPAAFAATPVYQIDTTKTASLNIYKIDFTNAKKDGVWDEDSFVSTGWRESYVEDTLITNAKRKGTSTNDSTLGNGETSHGYAISGVEFSILKVADIIQLSETDDKGIATDMILYRFSKDLAMLATLGLDHGNKSYTPNKTSGLDTDKYYYYTSDTLNAALATKLAANPTTTKNALESFAATSKATKMPLTDAYGHTSASNLPLGLYLLVETAVPEMVTGTCNPCFVSLPMTTVSGNANSASPTGGTAWNYDVTVYPKNETGIPTLEKTVREAKADTGKNNASSSITDGFAHTATGSAGDVMEYQIISTLPSITSKATFLSTYSFFDTLAAGLTYNQKAGVKIEIFRDKACTDLVTTWTAADGKFSTTYADHSMTVTMSTDGLAAINGTTGANSNGATYSGYSNYTMRLTYSATINSDTSFVYGEEGNRNKVVLTWKRSSSSYYDTLVDDAHVYSFGIDLTKTFSDQASKDAATAGKFNSVSFRIFNSTDGYFLVAKKNVEEGVYYVTGHTDVLADATLFTPIKSGDDYGKVIIWGVEDDSYTVDEVTTANGYTLLKDAIPVTITATANLEHCTIYAEDTLGVLQNDPRYAFGNVPLANIPQKALDHVGYSVSATVNENETSMRADGTSVNAAAQMLVVNRPGLDLPATGDLGTWMFTVFGVLGMFVAAGVVIFFSRKRNKA